jgi:type II secretory pathway component GspD/PulD (secretin)
VDSLLGAVSDSTLSPPVAAPVRTKDQVPLLGDVPLLGRFFRSESSRTHQNRLYVFLTPVEVDGAHRRN